MVDGRFWSQCWVRWCVGFVKALRQNDYLFQDYGQLSDHRAVRKKQKTKMTQKHWNKPYIIQNSVVCRDKCDWSIRSGLCKIPIPSVKACFLPSFLPSLPNPIIARYTRHHRNDQRHSPIPIIRTDRTIKLMFIWMMKLVNGALRERRIYLFFDVGLLPAFVFGKIVCGIFKK